MFNDFKILSYKNTKQKISKLKDIFDRLNLSALEERLENLLNGKNTLDNKISALKVPSQPGEPGDPGDQGEPGEPSDLGEPGDPRNPPPPLPPPIVNLPDLTILSINTSLQTNYINFKITVKNVGLAISAATTLTELIPELLSNSVGIPSLAPEETFTTNVQYSFDPSGTIETKTFLTEVNPSRSLIESSYSNNSDSVTVEVKRNYIPDGNSYYILHAHIPEGKEVGSIKFRQAYYNPDIPLRETPYSYPGYYSIDNPNPQAIQTSTSIGSHGVRSIISAGLHTFRCQFNNITLTQVVNCLPNTTTTIIFTFPRNILSYTFNTLNDSGSFYLPFGGSQTQNRPPFFVLVSSSPEFNSVVNANMTAIVNLEQILASLDFTVVASGVVSTTAHYSLNSSGNAIPITLPIRPDLWLLFFNSVDSGINLFPEVRVWGEKMDGGRIIAPGNCAVDVGLITQQIYDLKFGISNTILNSGTGHAEVSAILNNFRIADIPFDSPGTSF